MKDKYDIKDSNPRKNPYTKKLKKQITININVEAVDYFKDMAEQTGIPYQTLINLYGFNQDGILRIEEYYPNMLEQTYKGVSGYIYSTNEVTDSGFELQIPDAVTSSVPVPVSDAEFVPDAYEAIMEAEAQGKITIVRYEDMPEKMRTWIGKIIPAEYTEATDHPEYRYFLKENFPNIIKE